MVRRVVSLVHPARRRGVTHRPFLLGSLAAAALLVAACGSDDSGGTPTSTTVAAPAAEQSATGSAGASAPAEPTADGKVAATDSMMAFQPVEYVYEGDMPALDGPAQAWRWAPGRMPTTEEVAALAAALGVEGDVTVQSPDQGGGWVVGGDPSPRLWVSEDAQGSWSYIGDSRVVCMDDTTATATAVEADAAPAISPDDPGASSNDQPTTTSMDLVPTTVIGPVAGENTGDVGPDDGPVAPPDTVACVAPVGIPTADEAQGKSTELLQALGLDPAGYEITADSQDWGAWVDARLVVDGIAAPVLTSFGFGPEGALTYASGQLFAPEASDLYTRIGTTAALEQLKADQFRSYNPEIDPAATDIVPLPATEPAAPDTPVSAPAEQSPAVDAADPVETTVPPEPVTVVLTGVEPGWWMIWADDGTTWLLPGYDFVTEHGERISTPAVAQIDMPVADTMTGTEPAPGAGEAPAEPDIASPLGD